MVEICNYPDHLDYRTACAKIDFSSTLVKAAQI